MPSMKILVFSDSHGSERGIRRAISLHADAQGVFFLGDGLASASLLPELSSERFLIGVLGNCDSFFGLPSPSGASEQELITLFGYRLLLVHGHREGVKGGLDTLIAKARRLDADAAFFGHTHVPYHAYLSDGEKPLYLFNPGSVSRPDRGNPSYGVLLLTEKGILLSHGEL